MASALWVDPYGLQQVGNIVRLRPRFLDSYTLPLISCTHIRLDLPWWEKLFGASFRNGRFQMRQLTGGKMDDITVIVSMVVQHEKPAPVDNNNGATVVSS